MPELWEKSHLPLFYPVKPGNMGFTLLELMVVVVILSILAAVVIPRVMDRPERASRIFSTLLSVLETAGVLYPWDNWVQSTFGIND